jgi:enterochelin esterase-like enzyme
MKKRSKARRRRKDSPLKYLLKIDKSGVTSRTKMRFLILTCVLCLVGILSPICWYVFGPDVPQLDGPQAIAQDTNLSYQITAYNSQVMGGERTYGVCLPPGYAQNPQQRYPVIFLLHGGHGDPTDWFKKGAALSVIQQVYNSGNLPPSIIITPDGNDRRGSSPFFDPQYIDGPNGRVNTAIGNELVKVVQSRYRTLPAPAFWAMGGLSSGGWGALNVGLHNLNNFSVLFSHSGYFSDRTGAENSPILYIRRVPRYKRSRLRIYLDAGEQDGKFLEESQRFDQVLTRLKIPHVFNQFPGGHGIVGADTGWNYWHKHLADSLSYVGKQFRDASVTDDADTATTVSPKNFDSSKEPIQPSSPFLELPVSPSER